MKVTAIPNRRMLKASTAYHRIALSTIQESWEGTSGGRISSTNGTSLFAALTKLNYYTDQQSARLAAFIHRPSFAGVPALPTYNRYPSKYWSGPASCRVLLAIQNYTPYCHYSKDQKKRMMHAFVAENLNHSR